VVIASQNGFIKISRYEIFEPSEALAQKGILSLEEKFLAGEGQNITPARFSAFPEENNLISAQVRDTLMRSAKVLNIEGYCRIDAFVRIFDANHVEVIFIEVNSLPGLTPATCIFHQAALNGYKPFDFLDQIIQYGIAKVQNA
ncbi:MAG: D-alanine--D-alanine ligase, partial [Sphingobacteriales bacterium]